MSGETFLPKKIITRGKVTRLVIPGQAGSLDGAFDAPNDQQAMTGAFTQTLAADPPGAMIFVCHCGHMRRVTYSETNFRCEKGGVGNDCTCPILWKRKLKDSGEIDENTGAPILIDDTVDEMVEVVDELTGKKAKMKVARPQFEGRLVGELKAEELRRRAAKGETVYANPTNEVTMLNYQTSKQQMDKKMAAERAKQKE